MGFLKRRFYGLCPQVPEGLFFYGLCPQAPDRLSLHFCLIKSGAKIKACIPHLEITLVACCHPNLLPTGSFKQGFLSCAPHYFLRVGMLCQCKKEVPPCEKRPGTPCEG